jgi:hypothetical protein
MAQVGNNENRFGGEFMIQDRDHLSEIPNYDQDNRGQAEQSQTVAGQQGGNKNREGSQRGGSQPQAQ